MRDKLIELANDVFKHLPWGQISSHTAEELADYLIANGVTFADVTDTNVGKWIPVSERLPTMEWEKLCKKTGAKVYKCLIYRQSFLLRNNYYMTFGHFDGKRFIDIESSSPIGSLVTHWMPIPEAPKEDE